MIQSTVGAASSLLLTGRAGLLGLHVKPPPFTGRWEDQEATYVVLDLEGAEYNVDLPEKVRGAVPSHGGAATAGDELLGLMEAVVIIAVVKLRRSKRR